MRLFLIFAIAFVLSWIPALVAYLIGRQRQKGDRVIVCPETGTAEVVRVDARRAAITELVGPHELRLESCTRWPERDDCGRACLAQIEAAPDGCLVHARLTAWYEGATCAFCEIPIGPVRWHDRRPGLLSPDARVRAWDEIAPRDLPKVLETHLPVCFDCYNAESFREHYPEKVVEDPWHAGRRPAERKRAAHR
jgi:hypothetical protein